jgi:hypothetical protein
MTTGKPISIEDELQEMARSLETLTGKVISFQIEEVDDEIRPEDLFFCSIVSREENVTPLILTLEAGAIRALAAGMIPNERTEEGEALSDTLLATCSDSMRYCFQVWNKGAANENRLAEVNDEWKVIERRGTEVVELRDTQRLLMSWRRLTVDGVSFRVGILGESNWLELPEEEEVVSMEEEGDEISLEVVPAGELASEQSPSQGIRIVDQSGLLQAWLRTVMRSGQLQLYRAMNTEEEEGCPVIVLRGDGLQDAFGCDDNSVFVMRTS